MLIIDLAQIAFAHANGNYTEITYISGQKQLITIGLSKVEEFIRSSRAKGSSTFVRMGRSLIINQLYVYAINILKQRLVLSDYCNHSFAIQVPKLLLKEYKKAVASRYAAKEEE